MWGIEVGVEYKGGRIWKMCSCGGGGEGVEAGQAFMAYCLQRVVDKTGWMAWCFLAVWGSRVV